MQDLNFNSKLPFEDNTFDVITNVVYMFPSTSEYYFLKLPFEDDTCDVSPAVVYYVSFHFLVVFIVHE